MTTGQIRANDLLRMFGPEGHPTSGRSRADRFTGSPTFLLNGRDPFAEPGRPAGLTCRVYRAPDGLRGLPGLG
ncbi:hypothetical protein ACFUNF_27160 [Streptomyces sp. NPDC057291]|uniref:hypothetical protein n=1 Tax=Streptomyces sp. NPDC057291 TaxID=3346087 RepID=UPI003634AF22